MDSEIILPEPLGRLSMSQFQRALDVFALGTLEAVTPTTTGNLNQNAFLRTSMGEFVFRGAPTHRWQFPKEQFFAGLISRHTTIRTPWLYHYHPATDIFDWPFAIMPRLEGFELNSLQPANERGPEAWRAVARAQAIALGELHAATFERPGDFSLATGGLLPFPGSYGDWVVGEIRTRLAESPTFSADDAKWIMDRALAWNRHAGDAVENVIVHGDFGYWNMLFARSAGAYQVVGVFDLTTATIGDGVADLAYQHAKYVEIDRAAGDEFLKTYLARRGMSEAEAGFDERFHLYLLHERVSLRDYSYRHAPEWIDWNVPFREWLAPYFLKDSRCRDVR